MKFTIKGKGHEVTLDKRNFIAKGGEGEIYAKGGVAYKICEPGKMIPAGKFVELAVMTDPHIIKPQDILIDAKHQEVGYTLRYLDDTYTLCQLLTKAFCNRNNVTFDMRLALVRQMQHVIHTGVHPHRILLVDLNENNFLVSKDFKEVFFIDVNSYQTPSYKATAIMDSIRDRHCQHNQFNVNTDWLSFGIVSFELFAGIHPFKGNHPKFSDPKTALDERMKHNISIFNPEVTYPKGACHPISAIPDAYRKWYEAMFDRGMRLPPPKNMVETIQVVQAVRQIVGSNNFNITELNKFLGEIVKHWHSSGRDVIVTTRTVYVDGREFAVPATIRNISFTPKTNKPIGAYFDGRKVCLFDILGQKEVPIVLEASNMLDYDGRIYIQNGLHIQEIILNEMGGHNLIASPHVVGNCMELATKFFDGVVIQRLFDSYYASVFVSTKTCHQFPLKDFEHHKIIDAKFYKKVLVIVGIDKQGHYDRFTYRFDKDMNIERMSVAKDVLFTGINFTVLDNGICILMTEDEKIQMFKAASGSTSVKEISDPAIEGDMVLTHKGATAMVMKDNKLYSISMRNP